MKDFNLNRRTFIKGTAAASLAVSATGARAMTSAPKYNVALIGTGWYGTSDLLRLIQVADVEVVSLCDVDTKQLDKAATRVSKRQKSGKRPKLYTDYKKMLKEQNKLCGRKATNTATRPHLPLKQAELRMLIDRRSSISKEPHHLR